MFDAPNEHFDKYISTTCKYNAITDAISCKYKHWARVQLSFTQGTNSPSTHPRNCPQHFEMDRLFEVAVSKKKRKTHTYEFRAVTRGKI
jgi:hypothetical protein